MRLPELFTINIFCALLPQVLSQADRNQSTSWLNTTESAGFINDLAAWLDSLGYSVRPVPGGRLVALDGDVAVPPEQILSQTEYPRRAALWREAAGRPLIRYYTAAGGSDGGFSGALRSWTEPTCVSAVRLADGPCGRPAGPDTLCVGNFSGCWSHVGRQWAEGRPQLLSLEEGLCGPAAARHQLGHLLGLHHQHQRADRHQFLRLHPENTAPRRPAGGGSRQAGRCPPARLAEPPPTPFDPLSAVRLRSAAFSDGDQRAVLVTRTGRRQYLLDYGVLAGLPNSHLDRYAVNVLYGCHRARAAVCSDNGQRTTRCRNFGYLGRHCRCHCAAGYEGENCGNRTGPMFPPMAKAVQVDVNSSQTVHLRGMAASKQHGPHQYWDYVQFFTVSAIGQDNTQVSITIHLQPVVLRRIAESARILSSLVTRLPNEHELLLLMWGHPEHAALRSEMFSSVARNESAGLALRGKWSQLQLTASSALGHLLRDPSFTVLFLHSLSLAVEFSQRAESALSVQRVRPAGTVHTPPPPAEMLGQSQTAGLRYGGGPPRRSQPLVVAVGGVSAALLLTLLCSLAVGRLGGETKPRKE